MPRCCYRSSITTSERDMSRVLLFKEAVKIKDGCSLRKQPFCVLILLPTPAPIVAFSAFKLKTKIPRM